ncbi:hypothetical protein ACFXHA_40895 [Nocardia sp. NPDC059240]|uniref:hypothetical protein n=1 Tax=Nocardia sp. NPDC059240 TaxID=3346786 RepID=UPI0036BB6F99
MNWPAIIASAAALVLAVGLAATLICLVVLSLRDSTATERPEILRELTKPLKVVADAASRLRTSPNAEDDSRTLRLMSDAEIERLRAEIQRNRLEELQADREDILADLDEAHRTKDRKGIAFAEKQLDGIDETINALLDRRGTAVQDEIRNGPKPVDPTQPNRLF